MSLARRGLYALVSPSSLKPEEPLSTDLSVLVAPLLLFPDHTIELSYTPTHTTTVALARSSKADRRRELAFTSYMCRRMLYVLVRWSADSVMGFLGGTGKPLGGLHEGNAGDASMRVQSGGVSDP